MPHAEGWPEGLTREDAVAAARHARHSDDLVRSGPFTMGDPALADAVHAAWSAALTGEEAPPSRTTRDAVDADAGDADAEDFRTRYGYPIDAKRLPAGVYELTGVDAWNQVDPTRPGGVRLRRRGERISLNEHEASRLLFIGAISDPDAVQAAAVVETDGALASAVTARDRMVDQLEAFRERHRDKLVRNARERDQLRHVMAETKRRIAALDVEDEQVRAVVTCSDDELASRLGGMFADTFASLNRSISKLRGSLA